MIPKPKRIKDKKAIEQARKPYCQYCFRYGITEIHHLKSRGAGGDDISDNLIALCPLCHRKAHDGNISREKLRWTNTT